MKNTVASKVMVIGIDAPIAKRVYEFALDGELPEIKKILDNGVYGENALVPYPTITPPNWTAIATGASLGTHGITDFNLHLPGDPLDKMVQAFDSNLIEAEYIWNAAEKAGKKSIILNYPTSWPCTAKSAIQVGGQSVFMNEWRTQEVAPGLEEVSFGADQIYSTEIYPLGVPLEMQEAKNWKGVESLSGKYEIELKIGFRRARVKMKGISFYGLIEKNSDGQFSLKLCYEKDTKTIFANLKNGEWSSNIYHNFETEIGNKDAAFRCKVINLNPDSDEVTVYMTSICALDGWSEPESVARKIQSKEGLPIPNPYNAMRLGWIDLDTTLELVNIHDLWLADAASYLLDNEQWDLFFMHTHTPDSAYHSFADKLNKENKEYKKYKHAELMVYKGIDNMIASITKRVPDDTLIIIVSDHGAKTIRGHFSAADVMIENGLTVLKNDNADKKGSLLSEYSALGNKKGKIDWEKTKAVAIQAGYVYVNLKGRDPDGCVEPGKEYDEVCDQIIDALLSYRDSSGKRPVSLAIKKRDALVMGLYGDRVGDVVYALDENYGHEHGQSLSTVDGGEGDLHGLFIMSGPGVKKGEVIKRVIWLQDVVPTICYIAELPVPEQTEGAIIYQALENPNAKLNEHRKLKEAYQRLKDAYESTQSLTHTY